jgi:hypothetical protein
LNESNNNNSYLNFKIKMGDFWQETVTILY